MSHSRQSFSDLGVHAKLLTVLAKLKFVTPTPIQAKAIPSALRGQDVIGIAQTGTGKTLAFTLPMIERIAQSKKQGLIIAPTRELAEQIIETLSRIGQPLRLRHALVIGGASMGRQVSALKHKPHVIVGTPGRINDHLEQGTLKLHNIGVLVLDEADRMFDMGFAPQIAQILQQVPKKRQTMLFSATMPRAIERLARQHLHAPVSVQASPAGTLAERVIHELFVIPRQDKIRLLDRLLSDYTGTVLVFSRTKHGARKICRAIRSMNHAAAEIHSNLTTAQRRRSLAGFKSGTVRVMVATDIASRGIDVADIELVINYDLPDQLEDYVHRAGRTGRAGKRGKAISFVHPDQRHQIRTIERLVRKKLPISPVPELAAHRGFDGSKPESDRSGGHRRRKGQSRSAQRRSRPVHRRARHATQRQGSARRVRVVV